MLTYCPLNMGQRMVLEPIPAAYVKTGYTLDRQLIVGTYGFSTVLTGTSAVLAPPLAKSTPSKIVNREPFLSAQAPTDWATSLKNISIKHPDNKNGIYQTFEYLAAYLP